MRLFCIQGGSNLVNTSLISSILPYFRQMLFLLLLVFVSSCSEDLSAASFFLVLADICCAVELLCPNTSGISGQTCCPDYGIHVQLRSVLSRLYWSPHSLNCLSEALIPVFLSCCYQPFLFIWQLL